MSGFIAGALTQGRAFLGRLLPQAGRAADDVARQGDDAARAATRQADDAAGAAARQGDDAAAGARQTRRRVTATGAAVVGAGVLLSNRESDPPTQGSAAPPQQDAQARIQRLVPQGAANSILDKVKEDGRFWDNPLNPHFQVAYNWRIFATNDRDVFLQANDIGQQRQQRGETAERTPVSDIANILSAMDQIPQVTIAQSGVTAGFNIKSVQITGVVAPNYRTRNFNAKEFQIEIVEPLGTAFTDALAMAGDELGVHNFQRTFYFLELTFKGYDESGTPTNPVASEQYPNGGRWVWMVKFEDLDVNFTASGGTYTIKAIPYEEQIFQNERIMRLPENRSVSGNTVQGFLDNLVAAMNEGWINRYGRDTTGPDGKGIVHFEKVVLEDVDHRRLANGQRNPGAWRLTPVEGDAQTERNRPMSIRRGPDNTPTGQFPMGTAFTDVIEEIFASCEYARDLGLDRPHNRQGQVDESESRVNDRGFRESVLFRVEPYVSLRSYDLLTNLYSMDVTLYVRPYRTQVPTLSDVEIENADNPQVQQKMLDALNERDFLRKRYEYLFTGRNTEIKSLDVRYNLKWAAVVPAVEGAQRRIEQSDPGARRNDETRNAEGDRPQVSPEMRSTELRAARAAGRAAMNESASRSRDVDRITTDIERLRREVGAAQSDEQRNEINLRLRMAEENRNEQALARASAAAAAEQARQRINQLTPPREVSQRLRESGRGYAEEEIRSGQKRPQVLVSLEQTTGREMAHVAGFGFNAPTHRDKSLFGAVLEQLYAPLQGFLVAIDIEIRGDPFWLGQGNLERQLAMRPVTGNRTRQQAQRARLAEYLNGDICFLLVMRYPYTIGEDSAPMRRDQDIFNGIYHPVEITHTFSEGEFTQKLSCRRLPLLDVFKAFGADGVRGVTAETPESANARAANAAAAAQTDAGGPLGPQQGATPPNQQPPAPPQPQGAALVRPRLPEQQQTPAQQQQVTRQRAEAVQAPTISADEVRSLRDGIASARAEVLRSAGGGQLPSNVAETVRNADRSIRRLNAVEIAVSTPSNTGGTP